MHSVVKNLLDIENNIKLHLEEMNIKHYPKVIAVSKTFKIEKHACFCEKSHFHPEQFVGLLCLTQIDQIDV